jgi:hypothetical protein
MNSHNIKQVSISGNAANEYAMATGGKRRTRRRNMLGGNNEESPALSNNTAASTKSINLNITKGDSSAPINIPTSTLANTNIPLVSAPQQGGQSQQQVTSHPKPKIVIAPKQRSRKVILAPKHSIIKPQLKSAASTHKKSGTKRRVSVNITTVKNKIAKTRKHIRESQHLPIDKIRKELISSKLLNPASKAPDALLRKIYADMKIISH